MNFPYFYPAGTGQRVIAEWIKWKFLYFLCKALPNLVPSHPSGLITCHCLWSLWPLQTVLQLLNMTLARFWVLAYTLYCFLYLESPFLLIFFYLGKLMVSSRSRSNAAPSVKPSLHIYYTFLWNFSSQVWLCTFFLAP